MSNSNSKHIPRFMLGALLGSFALTVFFTNCSTGDGFGVLSDPVNFASSAPLTTEMDQLKALGTQLYNQNCTACHGDIESWESKKLRAGEDGIFAAINTVPQMSSFPGLAQLSSNQIRAISYAIRGPDSVIADAAGNSLFLCDSSQVRANSALRLSNREISASLKVLLQDFGVNSDQDAQLQTLINNIPSDVSRVKFARQENSFLNSQSITNAVFESVFRAAQLASQSTNLGNYPNTNGCLAQASITQTCHNSFVQEFSAKAFRRSLSATELQSLQTSTWSSSLSKADLIVETVGTILAYPDFFYKAFDQGTTASANSIRITGLALANKLSLFLTGQPADSNLMSAARNGTLENSQVWNAQVDRLLSSQAGADQLRRLFRESYGYDVVGGLQYPTSFLNGASTANLSQAMVQELDHFFVDEVLTRRSAFETLFTSRNSIVTQNSLASIYGLSAASPTTPTVLSAERSGFLTRAALLTRRASYYTSPVDRGLYMMEKILCDKVGDPPANAPTTVSESQIIGQFQSTRDRYHGLTEQPGSTCITCHSRINSYGYPFESFDSLGRVRTQESIFNTTSGVQVAQVALNTSSEVKVNLAQNPVAVSGVSQLSERVGSSDMAKMCFAKHVRAFDTRYEPGVTDSCEMNEVVNVLYRNNGASGSVVDAIKAYVNSASFRTWNY